MNISSKKWQIRTNPTGFGYMIINRETQNTTFVSSHEVESSHHYAMISETQFDKEMEVLGA